MKFTERRYSASEAVFLLRTLLGPDFGNLYTVLADQRRGKNTSLPFISYRTSGGGIPYYLSSDLMSFVEAVRTSSRTRRKAKAGVRPVFSEVDLDKEISL
jgi:hypothetical protein